MLSSSLVVLTAVSAGAASPTALEAEVAEARGVARATVVSVTLPDRAPDRLQVQVEHRGAVTELALQRRSLRGDDFRVRLYRDGRTDEVAPPAPARTYTGTVLDDPGSRVAGGFVAGGLWLRVRTGDGRVWWLEPLARALPDRVLAEAADGRHLVYDGDPPPPEGGACGVGDHLPLAPEPPPAPAEGADGALTPPCELHRTEIAFDVDFPYYTNQGSDVAATIANVEAIGTGPYESGYRYLEPNEYETELISIESIGYADAGHSYLAASFLSRRGVWRAPL